MSTCKGVRIRTKLMAIVAGLAILLMISTGVGIYQLRSVDGNYYSIYQEDTSAAAVSAAAGMHFNQGRAVLLRSLMQQDPMERQASMTRLKELDAMVDAELDKLQAKAVSAEGKTVMQQVSSELKNYRERRAALLQLSQNGMVDMNALMAAQKEAKSFSGHLDQIYAMANDSGTKRMESVRGNIDLRVLMTVGISILVILAALLLGITVTRTLVRRIHKLGVASDEIAEGDLSEELAITNEDELGAVAESFEKMRVNVQKAIAEIHMAADQVAAGAKNVSDASVSLSQGAAEQASSVEELSSSIAEIASQTRSNADNAEKANDLALQAQNYAQVGDKDMKEMLEAMEGINASSANISKIIKVIDEIAFQTNILALNAAVEAARAGQHGKGFAVVAEEVRNLAARSAKAAKETTDMIEGSIAKVNGGRDIANKTAEALQSIVTHVADVADLVGSIATASKEQNIAIEQINQGVLQVSQVVQSNSATSEESAAASEELSAQANLLKITAGKFKLSADGQVSVRQVTAPPALPSSDVPSSGHSAKPKKIALTEEEGFGKY